jgi:hypothetical protein
MRLVSAVVLAAALSAAGCGSKGKNALNDMLGNPAPAPAGNAPPPGGAPAPGRAEAAPAAVQNSLRQNFPGASDVSYVRAGGDWNAAFKKDGDDFVVTFAPNGIVQGQTRYTDRTAPNAVTPESVNAVQRRYPGAAIENRAGVVRTGDRGRLTGYEYFVTAGGKKIKVFVGPKGSPLEERGGW